MDDISELLKEAKPLYFQRKRRQNVLKSFGALSIAALLYLGSFQHTEPYFSYDFDSISTTISALQNGSTIEDLGLPVDEYGFLRIS